MYMWRSISPCSFRVKVPSVLLAGDESVRDGEETKTIGKEELLSLGARQGQIYCVVVDTV